MWRYRDPSLVESTSKHPLRQWTVCSSVQAFTLGGHQWALGVQWLESCALVDGSVTLVLLTVNLANRTATKPPLAMTRRKQPQNHAVTVSIFTALTAIRDNSSRNCLTGNGPTLCLGAQTLLNAAHKITNQFRRRPQEFLLIACLASPRGHIKGTWGKYPAESYAPYHTCMAKNEISASRLHSAFILEDCRGGPLVHSPPLSPRVVIHCVKHQSLSSKSPLHWRLSLEPEQHVQALQLLLFKITKEKGKQRCAWIRLGVQTH